MRSINYNNYFWQDEVVRLRAIQPEDWEGHYINRFDSPARRLLECAVELPPTVSEAKAFADIKTFEDLRERHFSEEIIENLMSGV